MVQERNENHFKTLLICKNAAESKIIKCMEKFGRNFLGYSVSYNEGVSTVKFSSKNLDVRNEILRRLRHIKGFEQVSIETEKVWE